MKFLFVFPLLVLMGCKMSSLYPALGAGAGGSAGSLAGPVTGGLGAVAGYSVGEVLKVQDQPNGSSFKPKQYAELISLVNTANGETKSFTQKIEDGVYNILKIVGMIIVLIVIGTIFYTRLKCNKTLKLLGLNNEDLERVQRNSK